jgi:hypothetical protein
MPQAISSADEAGRQKGCGGDGLVARERVSQAPGGQFPAEPLNPASDRWRAEKTMSFLSRLFGGGGSQDGGKDAKAAATEDYKGFTIKATPMAVGGEFQLAGVIEKEMGGERKSYKFVRADRLSSRDEAASRTIDKGRQLVDEQGDKLFS